MKATAILCVLLAAGGASAADTASDIKKQVDKLKLPRGVALPASEEPASAVIGCVVDMRYHVSAGGHSVSGFLSLDDGRLANFAVGDDGVTLVLSAADGSIRPHRSGRGFAPAAEPGVVSFIERASTAGVRLQFALLPTVGGAGAGDLRQVDTIIRDFSKGAPCI